MLFCPSCGGPLERVEESSPAAAYKALYQEWQEVTKKATPPRIPDESIKWVCRAGCFTVSSPLLQHHTAGTTFAPSLDSWALTYKKAQT